MRHLLRNSILILIVLIVSGVSIYPPKENLRLGKDLAGGVSLTYSVQLNPDDPPEVVDSVIQVLNERVNPDGLFEISMVRQGRDRIEVTMPLPSKEVQELKNAYDLALAQFDAFTLDSGALERALRLKGDERHQALTGLMTSEPRTSLVQPVIDAVDHAEVARKAYDDAVAAGAEETQVGTLLNEAAEAEISLDDARRKAIASSVTPDDVREALLRSDETTTVRDEGGEPFTLPSPRERAVEALRKRLTGIPQGEETLDATLATLDRYNANRKGLDDPEDLERLLQGAGVLSFRISIRPGELNNERQLRQQIHERGPAGVESDIAGWYVLNKVEDWFDTVPQYKALQENPSGYFAQVRGMVVEEYDGEYYALFYDTPDKRLTAAEGNWALSSSYRATDQLGRPAVGFTMDPRGAVLFGDFTGANVQQPMAVLLDGRVFTVATIQQRLTRQSIIQGTFSDIELNYLIKTLNAGSLQARLSDAPISISRLAPDLGADNLRKGLRAAWISFIVVSVFMVCYYFTCGFVAVIALLCNAILILGAMSLARAAFTLPGIAGIVLTFGTAVDSNVLIYERLREELKAGNDLRSAVRIAYEKVLSTIVDANVTNLIVCFVLAQTGTQEIRGFAITLGIGVVATMFSSLLITRVIFVLLIEKVKIRTLSQLPIAIPAIDRLLTPKVDWIGLRWVYLFISFCFVGTGIGFIAVQGDKMLDTEFRGGTAIDLRLAQPLPDEHITFEDEPYNGTLTRSQVEKAIAEIVTNAEAEVAANPTDTDAQILVQLRNADVVAINPRDDGFTSNWFKIKTTIIDQNLLLASVVDRFAPVIDSKPALVFKGSEATNADDAPIYPVVDGSLGANIGRPDVKNDVSQYIGGAIVLLSDIHPPVSEQAMRDRIDYIRNQGAYITATSRRHMELVVIDGTSSDVKTAAIVVKDPQVNALYDIDQWKVTLAKSEWQIVEDGLAQPTTLAGVQSFSPEIAATFRGKAIVSVLLSFLLITLYIWARFGSIRFSAAAVFPLVHDVITAVGLIALAEILYDHVPGAAALGIKPFKIDLGLIAAILTIIGYSLNDTIVILDRIRENRGKLAYASREVINRSVNETFSRSVITSGTTLVALCVMFVIGGEGIASFTYALICGIVVGTYSSIAVAAPLVWTRKIPKAAEPFHRHAEAEADHSNVYENPARP